VGQLRDEIARDSLRRGCRCVPVHYGNSDDLNFRSAQQDEKRETIVGIGVEGIAAGSVCIHPDPA
jgi:hypothetical protein